MTIRDKTLVTVETAEQLNRMDLSDLCDATEATVNDKGGNGFAVGTYREKVFDRNILENNVGSSVRREAPTSVRDLDIFG